MSRIVYVHWNAAEAEDHARTLTKAGHGVTILTEAGPGPLKALADDPPDAVVIDLRRLPAHGREVGAWLRRRKATREVPLVFVEGDPEKTDRVRRLLPDAEFTPWSRVRSAVRRAVRNGGSEGSSGGKAPVVPDTMDYYEGVRLAKKLGITEGRKVMLLGAPKEYPEALGPLPEGATVARTARGSADVVLLFADSVRTLEKRFAAATARVTGKGRLWILWPKQASGVKTDLTQAAVRAHGLDRGWVDFKIAAVDSTWSGLCFVPRKQG